MSVIVADTLKARVAGAAVTTEKGLNVGGGQNSNKLCYLRLLPVW